MKKIFDFIKTHKYLIIWTICYTFATWAILYFMFNFSIFNAHQWHKLYHAQLRGFPGFVFGILILACVPLYVATSILIFRTKKPLITIQIPKIKIPKIWQKKPEATKEPETKQENKEQESIPEQVARNFPDEMRAAFAAAKNRIDEFKTYTKSTSEKTEENTHPNDTTAIKETILEPVPVMANDFPIPTDFDISFDDTPGFVETPSTLNAPVFTEITFDDSAKKVPSSNTIEPSDSGDDSSDIINYLNTKNIPFEIEDNIIITPNHAIATHSDSDFWVADTENWFAAGKTKPSPIITLLNIATANNLKPVLYLGATNILDLEKLIAEWKSSGIDIITTPDAL